MSVNVRSKHCVLFVDDEPDVTRSVRLALRKQPFEIITANSAQQGLEILASRRVDVVVSDERMPEMGGAEFLSLVKDRWPDTVRLILSGQASLESAMDAINMAGIYRFLVKPCDPQDLAYCLTQALEAFEEKRAFVDWESTKSPRARGELTEVFERSISGLYMVFQPIVRSYHESIFGYEALVRTSVPDVNPGELFSMAEELDRVTELERRIRECVSLRANDLPEGTALLMNLHPTTLVDEELYDAGGPLARHASQLVIEITERDTVHDVPDIQERVARLRKMGFRIAVDDLGAGYAGLTSFALLCPDIVKFDLELIRDIDREPTKAKLVASFNALCREMEILTIAEGVERAGERDSVQKLGCDLIQGYFYAKPGKEFRAAGELLHGDD